MLIFAIPSLVILYSVKDNFDFPLLKKKGDQK